MLRHPDVRLLHTGMGPARARIAAARALAIEANAVAVAGVCAAVSPLLRPGDVVCADELRTDRAPPDGASDDSSRTPPARGRDVPTAPAVAHLLHERGFRVHVGPLLSVERLTKPADRRALPGDTLAVDMESAWLADGAGGRPLAFVRVVADAADRALIDPRMLVDGPRALATLWRISDVLVEWAREPVLPHDRGPSRQTAGR
jgi:4-hydroxy-3-methylbut-2-enyl diphosphate reductase